MKFRIDHYLLADKYVPMVRFWRFGRRLYVDARGTPDACTYSASLYDKIEQAEQAIKLFNEWKTKMTIVRLDVKINYTLTEQRMRKLSKFNEKYKNIQK